MMAMLRRLRCVHVCIRTWIHCVRNGWSFDKSWSIGGGIVVKKMPNPPNVVACGNPARIIKQL